VRIVMVSPPFVAERGVARAAAPAAYFETEQSGCNMPVMLCGWRPVLGSDACPLTRRRR
jgi:hypothetical protein